MEFIPNIRSLSPFVSGIQRNSTSRPAAWNQFIEHRIKSPATKAEIYRIYNGKLDAIMRRHTQLMERTPDPQARKSQIAQRVFEFRALMAEVLAFDHLSNRFLPALNNLLGGAQLYAQPDLSGTKLPHLMKSWSDLADFYVARFEPYDFPVNGEKGRCLVFVEIEVKTSCQPGDSIKRAKKQFKRRERLYWSQGGKILVPRKGHKTAWSSVFDKQINPNRWIMLCKSDVPEQGENRTDGYRLLPLGVELHELHESALKLAREIFL